LKYDCRSRLARLTVSICDVEVLIRDLLEFAARLILWPKIAAVSWYRLVGDYIDAGKVAVDNPGIRTASIDDREESLRAERDLSEEGGTCGAEETAARPQWVRTLYIA